MAKKTFIREMFYQLILLGTDATQMLRTLLQHPLAMQCSTTLSTYHALSITCIYSHLSSIVSVQPIVPK